MSLQEVNMVNSNLVIPVAPFASELDPPSTGSWSPSPGGSGNVSRTDVSRHNSSHLEGANFFDHDNPHQQDQDDPPLECTGGVEEKIVFSPYYHVMRYTRTLRRSEVMGFGFICLVIMSIALQAQLGLEAVGLYVPTFGILAQLTSINHPAHSFSWRILSEFYIMDSISSQERECLYLNKNRVGIRGKNPLANGNVEEVSGIDPENELTRQSKLAKIMRYDVNLDDNVGVNVNGTHHLVCGRSRISDGWTWLCKYLINSVLPILNLCCAAFLLSCIRCRRKKGFQFTLMLPAFITVFIGIYQQVPMIFSYSYAGISLTEEMNESSLRGVSPVWISPIWDETQYHGKCCGIQSADTWTIHGRGSDMNMYPPSCCNTDTYECNDKYTKRHEVWNKGCFKQEYDRVRFYQFCSMIVMLVKLFAEMGILWSLSDLTRYEYPTPENQHNATCDVQDFEVQTKGGVTILGVTERQTMVIKLQKFRPRKYAFRTQFSGTCKIINIRSRDGHTGTVEIRRTRRNRNTEVAMVDLDSGRQQGLIFLSF